MHINNIQNEYNVITNTLKNDEYMFITYNTLIVMKEIGLITHMMENYDIYKDRLNLDLFLYKCKAYIIRLLLDRKEKDIIKWLVKDSIYIEELNNELYDYIQYTSEDIVTNFSTGLTKLLCSNTVKKMVISIDFKDINGLNILKEMFSEYIDSKIFIVDTKRETMIKYIKDKKYTLIMTDDIDLINECIDMIEGKSICIPYTGYNFEMTKDEFIIDDMELMMSKHKLEIKSLEYKFNLGFIEPFKISNEMFQMG